MATASSSATAKTAASAMARVLAITVAKVMAMATATGVVVAMPMIVQRVIVLSEKCHHKFLCGSWVGSITSR